MFQGRNQLTCCRALSPSFLYRSSKSSHEQLRSTAALDGLRGLAAFFVMNFHFFGAFLDTNHGWIPGDTGHQSFWVLPIIKFFHSGTSMVAIFFVISGYVLSLKSIKCIRQEDWATLLSTLTSSVFRRGMRLFGPTSICLALEVIALKLGLFELARANMSQIPQELDHFPPLLKTWNEHLHLWWAVVYRLGDCWTWDIYYPKELDSNLWTIALEFRSSMVLFLVLLGLAKVKGSRLRKGILGAFIAVCISYQRWEVVLFLCGMMLVEFDVPEADDLPRSQPSKQTRKQHVFWTGIILLGMYLCSSPMASSERAWGYMGLTQIAAIFYRDAWRFWESVGAVIMVWAATKSEMFKWLLTTEFVQYLGNISYALYLVHGPLIRWFGFAVVPFFWKFANHSVERVHMGIVAGYFIYVPVLFLISDVCWRLIDINCVRFSRWLESKSFGK